MKLSTALDGFWLHKQLAFSPNTIAKYRYFYARLLTHIGDVDIEQITTADIQSFLLHLATDNGPSGRPLSRRSVHDAWAVLSSLWSWAENELHIPHIIRGKIAAPAFTQTIIEPFTEAEVRALLRATQCQTPYTHHKGTRVQAKRATAARDRAIVLTLLDSGLRVSELCALCIADYDAVRSRLHVRDAKGNKARLTVVGNAARKAIGTYLAARHHPPDNAPLFASGSGQHLRRDNIRHMLARMGERAHVANVHPHRFRHTFAINFLRNGGNPLLLQALLGHAELETVLLYVKLAEQDIDAGRKHSPADHWQL